MIDQTAQGVLMSVSNTSFKQEEESEMLVCERKAVFLEHCIGGRTECKPWFNSMLQGLAKKGLVKLTRTTVQLTEAGFSECWE